MITFQQARMEIFTRQCPPLYLDTDESLLNPSAAEVLAIPLRKTGKGILLAGPTRTTKSRTAWMLTKRWFCTDYMTLMWFNGGSFGRAVADQYGNGTAQQWHERLASADILLLDDIFKHRATPAVHDAIFSVIEDRMAALLPTIITINNGFDGIKAVMPGDMAQPIIERLAESCDIFLFAVVGSKMNGKDHRQIGGVVGSQNKEE